MQTKHYKVAFAMAAGISLGAAAVEGLHAQAKRAGYVVAEINVHDYDGYMKKFLPLAAKAIEEAGGKYVVRGGRAAIGGADAPARVPSAPCAERNSTWSVIVPADGTCAATWR